MFNFILGWFHGIVTAAVVGAILYIGTFGDFRFFGGQIVSSYKYHFQNKIQCALVTGWYEKPKCLCSIVEQEENEGKVFIPMELSKCKN